MLTVIGNFETTITAKLTTAGTSLVLTTATDSEGNALPSGTYGFTLNEGKTNEEHIIGTLSGSTLTITKRNVRRTDGTTAGTGKEHRKGSPIKLTNFPALTLITRALLGTDTLPAVLKYASGVAPSTSDDLADKGYVDGVAIAGAPNSSTTVKGISKSSTAPTDAANPVHVEDTDPRLPTQNENDALVGTSGTAVSSSNKLVDAGDVGSTSSVQVNKIVRRDGNGDIILLATPTSANMAASKAYADSKQATYKNGVTTYTMSTASGTQTIAHGLGVTPRDVHIKAQWGFANAEPAAHSDGTYNGTTTATIWSDETTTNGTVGTDTTSIIKLRNNLNGDSQVASIAVDGTNITLTWTKTGTPTGTAYIKWEAIG